MPTYPSVSIKRTAALEQPFTGLGEGRITEATITACWRSYHDIPAGTLGFRSVSQVQVTPGTYFPGSVEASMYSRVDSRVSHGNKCRVYTLMKQIKCIRVGTPRYITYDVAFCGTPCVGIKPGSTIADQRGSGVPVAWNISKGSAEVFGTPTRDNCLFEAYGPGSYPLNLLATGV